MLSEKAAWLEIARRFRDAKPLLDDTCQRYRWNAWTESVSYGFGLCALIVDLEDMGHIDVDTRITISLRLDAYREVANRHGLYIWPTDRDGALARAEFCETQAENPIDLN